MTFRPLPVMTFFTLLSLAALLWLGTWQVTRSDWKAEAIEAYKARRNAVPLSLQPAVCGEAPAYDAAVLVDTSGLASVFRVYGQNAAGDVGWKLFAVLPAPECPGNVPGDMVILLQTGFEDFKTGAISTITNHKITQIPPKPTFSPGNSPEKNQWYWFDAPGMEATLSDSSSNSLSRDIMLVADEGLPASLSKTPPAKHIGYAVTWYGMAAALIALYAAFHIQAGRLSFRSGAKS